jgi:hypothetical protein
MFPEDAIDWFQFAAPEENQPTAVPLALGRIRTAPGQDGTYHDFLYAIGNNHCGTLYPIALPAFSILISLFEETEDAATLACLLNIFIDVLASFYPSPGHEIVALPNGERVPLKLPLYLGVLGAVPKVTHLTRGVDKELAGLAEELLTLLPSVRFSEPDEAFD